MSNTEPLNNYQTKSVTTESGDTVIARTLSTEDKAILEVTVVFNASPNLDRLTYEYTMGVEKLPILAEKVSNFDINAAQAHLNKMAAELATANLLDKTLSEAKTPRNTPDWNQIRQQRKRW